MNGRRSPARGVTGWMDRTFYPAYAHDWDSSRFREYVEKFVTRSSRMLNYGAGRGAMPQLNFRDDAAHVAGVDPDAIVLGNPHLDEAAVLPMPSNVIPYPAASFEVVFASNVLEHIEEPARAMSEIERVLVPGGVFVAKTPNRWHYVSRIARCTPQWFHELVHDVRGRPVEDTFPAFYRCNTVRAVTGFADHAGLEVVHIEHWEGRPEYLRFNPLLYAAGLGYERIVNSVPLLAAVRGVLVFTLRKPA